MATIEIGQVAFDPNVITASSLARCGDDEYEVVCDWVEAQREARRERALENDARVREIANSLAATTATLHQRQAAWARGNVP